MEPSMEFHKYIVWLFKILLACFYIIDLGEMEWQSVFFRKEMENRILFFDANF